MYQGVLWPAWESEYHMGSCTCQTDTPQWEWLSHLRSAPRGGPKMQPGSLRPSWGKRTGNWTSTRQRDRWWNGQLRSPKSGGSIGRQICGPCPEHRVGLHWDRLHLRSSSALDRLLCLTWNRLLIKNLAFDQDLESFDQKKLHSVPTEISHWLQRPYLCIFCPTSVVTAMGSIKCISVGFKTVRIYFE